MIPVMCAVKHDPENGKYADCVRACVASILELPSEAVPHFFADPEQDGQLAMQLWLRSIGRIVGMVPIPGTLTLDEMLEYIAVHFAGLTYMLWCSSGGGDHAIVADGTGIIHNPAWYKCPVDGPHSSDFWIIWIIAKL